MNSPAKPRMYLKKGTPGSAPAAPADREAEERKNCILFTNLLAASSISIGCSVILPMNAVVRESLQEDDNDATNERLALRLIALVPQLNEAEGLPTNKASKFKKCLRLLLSVRQCPEPRRLLQRRRWRERPADAQLLCKGGALLLPLLSVQRRPSLTAPNRETRRSGSSRTSASSSDSRNSSLAGKRQERKYTIMRAAPANQNETGAIPCLYQIAGPCSAVCNALSLICAKSVDTSKSAARREPSSSSKRRRAWRMSCSGTR